MQEKKELKKVFTIDTNVLMNDPDALMHYLRHGDVYLSFVVLEELDSLKQRGRKAAQDAIRVIEKITLNGKNGDLYSIGVSAFDEKGIPLVGKFFIKEVKYQRELKNKGLKNGDLADNKIINLAFFLHKNKDFYVRLISEDLNVRLKARALGLHSEGAKYLSASKETIQYKGFVYIDQKDIIFFENKDFFSKEIFEKYKPKKNQYFIVSDYIFYQFDGEKFLFKKRGEGVFGIKPRNIEQAILFDILLDKNIELVTISGVAGTGKTLLALAAGLLGKKKKNFDEILVSRREVGVGGEDHGFLPGDEKSKIAPYMAPFIDNLKTIKNSQKGNSSILEKMKGENSYPFETFSLIYLRGRTLVDSFIIVDEAQNLTPHQVKTLITRAGEGTKVILLGDIFQIDSDERFLRSNMNGISYVKQNLLNNNIYAHMTLQNVERSDLAKLGTMLP